MISPEELKEGLDKLGIFDNIPGWRDQLAAIVVKFDSSGDGSVSLKVISFEPQCEQLLIFLFFTFRNFFNFWE